MEVLLLLWDEIDDLLAPTRLLFTGRSAAPARIAPLDEPAERPLAAHPLV